MSSPDEPLREPEPERLSDLDKRLRERDRRIPWFRLIVLVSALVAILVFHQSISQGVAGCYGKYIPEQAPPKTPSKDMPVAPGEVPLTIEPAKPLPSP